METYTSVQSELKKGFIVFYADTFHIGFSVFTWQIQNIWKLLALLNSQGLLVLLGLNWFG